MIDDDTARRATIAVRCPHCRSAIGTRCVVPSTGKRLMATGCHPARVEALVQLRNAA